MSNGTPELQGVTYAEFSRWHKLTMWLHSVTPSSVSVSRRGVVKWRTTSGTNYVDALAERGELLRRYLPKLSRGVAVLAFLVTLGIVVALAYLGTTIDFSQATQPPIPSGGISLVGLLRAGVEVVVKLGVFAIAYHLLIIPLLPLVIIHELGHAVAATWHGYEVETFGLIAWGPFALGAFVQLYDPDWNARRPQEKLEVYAAGVLANFAAAAVSLIVCGILWVMSRHVMFVWIGVSVAMLNVLLAVTNLPVMSEKLDGYRSYHAWRDTLEEHHQAALKNTVVGAVVIAYSAMALAWSGLL